MLHFRNWLCSSVEQKQTNGCPSNLNWHAFNIRDSGSCNSIMPGGPQIPQSSLIMWYLNLFCLLFVFWKLIVEVACRSSTFVLLPSFSKECFRVETFKLYSEKADFQSLTAISKIALPILVFLYILYEIEALPQLHTACSLYIESMQEKEAEHSHPNLPI